MGSKHGVHVHHVQVETSGDAKHPIPVFTGQFWDSIPLPGGQIDKYQTAIPRTGRRLGLGENTLEQVKVFRGRRCSTMAKMFEQFGR